MFKKTFLNFKDPKFLRHTVLYKDQIRLKNQKKNFKNHSITYFTPLFIILQINCTLKSFNFFQKVCNANRLLAITMALFKMFINQLKTSRLNFKHTYAQIIWKEFFTSVLIIGMSKNRIQVIFS